MFVQGIYESRIASQFGPLVLLGLHSKAMKRNQDMGLTSFMYYDEKRIFQVVEGERSKVSRMLGMIGRSALHDELKVRAVLSRTERSFPHWPFGATHWQDPQFRRAFNTLSHTSFFALDVLEAVRILEIVASRKRRMVDTSQMAMDVGIKAPDANTILFEDVRSG